MIPNWLKEAWKTSWGLWLVMFIGFVIGFVTGSAKDSNGYEFNGEHWTKDYHYSIGSGCDSFQIFAVELGLKYFAPVPVYREANTGLTGLTEDGINTIYCSDTVPSTALTLTDMNVGEAVVANEAGAVIGKARWLWPQGSLEISECDIWLSTEADLITVLSVAPHESGHCWGLLHSKDLRSIMAPRAATSRPTLDDLAGLAHLYGNCGAVQIDHKGNVFLPAIDSRTLLREINDPKFKQFEDMVISGYLNMGDSLDKISGIAESKCN